jgi:hypothetical protein
MIGGKYIPFIFCLRKDRKIKTELFDPVNNKNSLKANFYALLISFIN